MEEEAENQELQKLKEFAKKIEEFLGISQEPQPTELHEIVNMINNRKDNDKS